MATSGAYFYSTSTVFVSSVAGFITSPVNTGSYFLKSRGPVNINVPVDAPPATSTSLPYNSAVDPTVYPRPVP
jgi:hypothetical protein